MSFYVYVLKSLSNGKFYIGQTSNLTKRIQQHNDPNYKLTYFTKRNLGPWKLVYNEEYPTRAEAMKREKQLKSGQGRNWLNNYLMQNH
jgi:putative endonuclease